MPLGFECRVDAPGNGVCCPLHQCFAAELAQAIGGFAGVVFGTLTTEWTRTIADPESLRATTGK